MKNYDPTLRLAMDEIKQVLKRHKIVAFINLGSQTHGEFMLHLDAPWSFLSLEEVSGGKAALRLRAKAVKVDTEGARNLDSTVAFVCNTADMMNRFGQIFYGLKAEIGKVSILTHEPITDDRISNDDREGALQ